MGMIGIARSEVRARAKRAEEKEKRRILEEKRAVVMKIIDDAEELLRSAEKDAGKAEREARSLTGRKAEDMSAEAIRTAASATEALMQPSEAALAQVLTKASEVEEQCSADQDLENLPERHVTRLKRRHETL